MMEKQSTGAPQWRHLVIAGWGIRESHNSFTTHIPFVVEISPGSLFTRFRDVPPVRSRTSTTTTTVFTVWT